MLQQKSSHTFLLYSPCFLSFTGLCFVAENIERNFCEAHSPISLRHHRHHRSICLRRCALRFFHFPSRSGSYSTQPHGRRIGQAFFIVFSPVRSYAPPLGVVFLFPGHTPEHPPLRETLIYSVWRRYFTFLETVEDGRVHSCFKKSSCLAKRNNYAFPKCHIISVS